MQARAKFIAKKKAAHLVRICEHEDLSGYADKKNCFSRKSSMSFEYFFLVYFFPPLPQVALCGPGDKGYV